MHMRLVVRPSLLLLFAAFLTACASAGVREPASPAQDVHEPPTVGVWQLHEITLVSQRGFQNPYTDVTVGVHLEGDGFKADVPGFWDGGHTFRVRVVAPRQGRWRWRSFSVPPTPGLHGVEGQFLARAWAQPELQANPNRRGFLRNTADGHALSYADGTPFFLTADTWWAASTWRYPFRGRRPEPGVRPGSDFSFEAAVAWRKQQGYNGIALIAAFPSWAQDDHPARFVAGDQGVREAWKKPGAPAGGAMDMHDEEGNRAFLFPGRVPDLQNVVPDYDQINPAYFRNLDKKLQHLSDEGFVPFLETVRRDHGPMWKMHHDWPRSFVRYVQYVAARYGAFNIIFSGVHFDWHNPPFSLDAHDYNQALTEHSRTHGPLPFGQPFTALADGSTLTNYGHGPAAPWLTLHGVGNAPRDHKIYQYLLDLYALPNALPALNQEPYYAAWPVGPNKVSGGYAEPDSARDHYYARTHAWGSVMSGGLAGHIWGSGAYSGNTVGEARDPEHPYIWESLAFTSAAQMQHLRTFLLSEGAKFQLLQPQPERLSPRRTKDEPATSLERWAHLLATGDQSLLMAYLEHGCAPITVAGLAPGASFEATWFNPRTGQWLKPRTLHADAKGALPLGDIPERSQHGFGDWAIKLVPR